MRRSLLMDSPFLISSGPSVIASIGGGSTAIGSAGSDLTCSIFRFFRGCGFIVYTEMRPSRQVAVHYRLTPSGEHASWKKP